jgi:hypothetical protein
MKDLKVPLGGFRGKKYGDLEISVDLVHNEKM